MEYKFKATHHGSLHGIPCWIDMSDEIAPGIKAKGGFIGEIALDFMELLFGCFTWCATALNPDYEPMYAIKVGKAVSEDKAGAA